jgi:ornithine cyclodeaminase/alanine dehydrogenase-like protein (mu-crystallin family)
VGADAEGKRELCESVIPNVDMIIYDNYEQCSHSGEIQYFEEDDRWDSLESVVSGRRLRDDQIQATLFDATGLAIEDVATGRYIYEKIIKSEHNS